MYRYAAYAGCTTSSRLMLGEGSSQVSNITTQISVNRGVSGALDILETDIELGCARALQVWTTLGDVDP